MIRKLDESVKSEDEIKNMILPFAKIVEEVGIDDFFDEDLPYIQSLKEINVKLLIKRVNGIDVDSAYKEFKSMKYSKDGLQIEGNVFKGMWHGFIK